MNTPVKFTIAKLLKEKGFDEKIKHAYVNTTPFSEDKNELSEYFLPQNHNKKEHRTSAPTIAEVVMWLYENHGIWIVPIPELFNGEVVRFYPSIFEQGVGEDIEQYYNSPTEAYEAAIEHVIKNLI